MTFFFFLLHGLFASCSWLPGCFGPHSPVDINSLANSLFWWFFVNEFMSMKTSRLVHRTLRSLMVGVCSLQPCIHYYLWHAVWDGDANRVSDISKAMSWNAGQPAQKRGESLTNSWHVLFGIGLLLNCSNANTLVHYFLIFCTGNPFWAFELFEPSCKILSVPLDVKFKGQVQRSLLPLPLYPENRFKWQI